MIFKPAGKTITSEAFGAFVIGKITLNQTPHFSIRIVRAHAQRGKRHAVLLVIRVLDPFALLCSK